MFYKILKTFSIFASTLVFICFIYSLFRLSTTDKLIMTMILILDISVCTFLIQYYGNAVIKAVFDNDNIILTKANKKIVLLNKNNCIKITETDTRLILYFKDNSYHYVVKYYGFMKNNVNPELFNLDNFPNAIQK